MRTKDVRDDSRWETDQCKRIIDKWIILKDGPARAELLIERSFKPAMTKPQPYKHDWTAKWERLRLDDEPPKSLE